MQGEGKSTPARSEFIPRSLPGDHQPYEGYRMSSAPSTLMRRKSPTDTRNQRAVWSSAAVEESSNSVTSPSGFVRCNAVHMEENPPIISMPSPSPSVLQQQTREVQLFYFSCEDNSQA